MAIDVTRSLVLAVAMLCGSLAAPPVAAEPPSRAAEATTALLEAFDAGQQATLEGDWLDALQQAQPSPAGAQAVEEIVAGTRERAADAMAQALEAAGGRPEDVATLAEAFGQGRVPHPDEPPAGPGRRVVIFVSQSMPEAELAALARSAPAGATIAFRGLLAGQTLGEFVRTVRAWSDAPEALASIVVDPRGFQELGIRAVPAVAVGEGNDWFALAYGVTAASGVDARIAAGERGELGVWGPTVPIAEEDMLARLQSEMPARLAERAKVGAARYWDSAVLLELPTAARQIERLVDPSIRVSRDIVLPDGKVLYRAGDRVNPFAGRGFTTRLIILDAREPWQVALAKDLVQEGLGVQRVQVALTGLDRSRGWEAFHAVGRELGMPVFLLTPELAERFALVHAPALLEGRGDQIFIREYARPEVPAPANEGAG